MFDDLLGKIENGEDHEFSHDEMCLLYCINLCNKLVEKGILSGGAYEISERGNDLLDDYWKEDPTDKDIELGMKLVKECGLMG
jgi:hypothetical protein